MRIPRLSSKCFSLPGVLNTELLVDGVEDVSFGLAPQRGDQQVFRTVPGEPVNDDIGVQMLHTGDDGLYIFFQSKDPKRLLLVEDCQVCPF